METEISAALLDNNPESVKLPWFYAAMPTESLVRISMLVQNIKYSDLSMTPKPFFDPFDHVSIQAITPALTGSGLFPYVYYTLPDTSSVNIAGTALRVEASNGAMYIAGKEIQLASQSRKIILLGSGLEETFESPRTMLDFYDLPYEATTPAIYAAIYALARSDGSTTLLIGNNTADPSKSLIDIAQ